MATLYTIPVPRDRVAHFVQTTTFDGRPFRLRFSWNGRIGRWFVSIATGAGVDLVQSKALVLGADVLRQVRWNPDAPQGSLTVVDLEGAGVEASLDSLGTRHRVVYFGA